MFFGFFFATNASATTDENGAIIENNTFGTAYPIGYWQYHGSTICKLEAGKPEAFFSFTANANDRVYASITLSQELVNTGAKVEIFNTTSLTSAISTGIKVVNPTSITPFIFANATSTANSQTFYIKVTRGTFVGDMYFPVSINNRILKSKAVLQYNLNGKFIKEYNSVTQAAKDNGFNQGAISNVCRGERYKAYGYIWKYKNI